MAPLTEGHSASIVEFVPELDRLAADVMADWKVPGAALAVVQDGKVALEGLRSARCGGEPARHPDDAVRDRLDHQIVYRDRCGSSTQ